MQKYRPKSQVEVETQLLEYCDLLEEATDEYGEALEELADAEAEYKKAKSSVYLRGTGTQKDREYKAEYDTADLLKEYKIAEGRMKHLREVMHARSEKIGALRTLNSNIRGQV